MNIIITKKNTNFIDFFIEKEKKFLFRLSTEAFNNKDFRFYIGWFIYAIDDYMKEKYDIKERFLYFFKNNYHLNIIFLIYIINDEFRQRVEKDIIEYKNKFGKEHIYD